MRSPSSNLLVLFAALGLAAPRISSAEPQAGQVFPSFKADDVTGESHRVSEFFSRRTLVVAITDPDGADGMRAWYRAADQNTPTSTQRLSILSFDLAFFIPAGTVRSRARDQIPKAHWHWSLIDKDGAMAHTLGLEESTTPYVFALGPDGRVLASFHGTAHDRGADVIWRTFHPDSKETVPDPGTAPSAPAKPASTAPPAQDAAKESN